MTNSEKNVVVLDCLNEALKKIYPDEKKIERSHVESTFKSFLAKEGLSGLYDNLVEVLTNTLVVCGLVGEDYLAYEAKPEVEPVEEAAPSVYAESL